MDAPLAAAQGAGGSRCAVGPLDALLPDSQLLHPFLVLVLCMLMPVLTASLNGHPEIVQFLCDANAYAHGCIEFMCTCVAA